MYNAKNYFPNYNNTNYQQSGLIWVQGEAGAKSYLVAPGCVAVLFDSERPVFYIKSTETNGMPQPLKVYDFSEHKAETADNSPFDMSQYVRKDELEQYINNLLGGKKDEQSSV